MMRETATILPPLLRALTVLEFIGRHLDPMTFDQMTARAQYEWDRAEKAEAEAQHHATALTEARAEIERHIGSLCLLDERCAQYERRAEQAERALAVLAPVRDMLILSDELGGLSPGETMADYLRRLIDEVASGESLRARVREVVGPLASADFADCRDCTDNNGRPYQSQWLADALRAARQLNEDLK